jgi:hypothetical protein
VSLGIFSEASNKSTCPGSTQPFEMSTRIFLGVKTAGRADNLTTLMCRLSRNPVALNSRTPQGHVGLFRGYLPFYHSLNTANRRCTARNRICIAICSVRSVPLNCTASLGGTGGHQQLLASASHLTLYSPVVTIRTASLTFNRSTFYPHSVLMCFVWI